jgi:hypothetical protein
MVIIRIFLSIIKEGTHTIGNYYFRLLPFLQRFGGLMDHRPGGQEIYHLFTQLPGIFHCLRL